MALEIAGPRSFKKNGTPLTNLVVSRNQQKASTLLEQIGSERSWSSRDIEKDVDILERNRLYSIKELRVLSPESWQVRRKPSGTGRCSEQTCTLWKCSTSHILVLIILLGNRTIAVGQRLIAKRCQSSCR